jgi:hypothetical protein
VESFAQELKDWQPFFSTVAAASATLVGLIFVSLSIHRAQDQAASAIDRFSMAQRSFGDFLYVIMLGLVFLVPHRIPASLAVALFVLGAARGIGLLRQGLGVRARRARSRSLADALRVYAIPGFAALGLLVVAFEVLRGNTESIFGLVLVVAALMTTGSWNAWLLLTEG